MKRSVLLLFLLMIACQAMAEANKGKNSKPEPSLPTPAPSVSPAALSATPELSPSLASAESTPNYPNKAEDGSELSGEIISGVIGAIIGALLGAGASQYLASRHARKQMKFETLRRFVANRFQLTGPEFSQVLNEIVIVYADSPQVTAALNEFGKERTNHKLVTLYRAMCRDTGIKDQNVSDELFLRAFNIKNS